MFLFLILICARSHDRNNNRMFFAADNNPSYPDGFFSNTSSDHGDVLANRHIKMCFLLCCRGPILVLNNLLTVVRKLSRLELSFRTGFRLVFAIKLLTTAIVYSIA
ncbi:unnamed protein product [Adineta ricciae]|uniref:Uncharacterized protein n=1 Tax=Adineta ricciae TaxID=249248 RepID=A0A815DTT2_ADIRI|nr:unnamed protein product [Adineta ricciae]